MSETKNFFTDPAGEAMYKKARGELSDNVDSRLDEIAGPEGLRKLLTMLEETRNDKNSEAVKDDQYWNVRKARITKRIQVQGTADTDIKLAKKHFTECLANQIVLNTLRYTREETEKRTKKPVLVGALLDAAQRIFELKPVIITENHWNNIVQEFHIHQNSVVPVYEVIPMVRIIFRDLIKATFEGQAQEKPPKGK